MTFIPGEYYLRKTIHEEIGGGEAQHFLAQKQGKILVLFYDSVVNPSGPEKIQVGKGSGMISKARALAAQADPIPVFRKANAKGANAGKYEYVGRYSCSMLSEEPADIAAEEARLQRPDSVSLVLTMQSRND